MDTMTTSTVIRLGTRLWRTRTLAPWLAALGLLLGAGQRAPGLLAQTGAPDGVPIDTIQLRPNVFMIVGAGGNVVVQVGPEGAILVNSGSAATADTVLSAVRALTPLPIRYIINTSADPEFVGGNETIGAAGVSLNANAFNAGASSAAILAREEVLTRMSAPTGQTSPFSLQAWPTDTFTGKQKSMYVNGDGIQLMHMPAAHSDGDSIVVFRRADVIVTGAILDFRHFPVIDLERGGSIQGEINALNRLMELAIPAMPLVWQEGRTLVVPGHGRIADQADLAEYRDMVTIVRDVVQSMIDKGMTLEQVKAANPTAGVRRRYGAETGPWTTDMFVAAVYTGLSRKP